FATISISRSRAIRGSRSSRSAVTDPHRQEPIAALLAAVIVAAWVLVVVAPTGMESGPTVFVAGWTLMMAAMMLPSVAPLVLLFRRGAWARAPVMLALGYMTVWAAVGGPAYFVMMFAPMTAGPVALAAAGTFQLTPLKQSCLRRCRSPADYLVQR